VVDDLLRCKLAIIRLRLALWICSSYAYGVYWFPLFVLLKRLSIVVLSNLYLECVVVNPSVNKP
jgi:hypothetical protein